MIDFSVSASIITWLFMKNKNESMKRRLDIIDALKRFGIILVVLGHTIVIN
jgi:hypothetical protein